MVQIGKSYTWAELRELGLTHQKSCMVYDIWYGHNKFVYAVYTAGKWRVTEIHEGGY